MSELDLVSVLPRIGYVFRSSEILEAIFTHPSYANEHPGTKSYQRLEFLGDSIVNCVVAKYLYATLPVADEGKMTKIRALSVSTEALAEASDRMGLAQFLRISEGKDAEEIRHSLKVRADLFEAIAGGIFCEVGFEGAERFVLEKLKDILNGNTCANNPTDVKSRLYEILAKRGHARPVFEESSCKEGFFVRVLYNGVELGSGKGRSKKIASNLAARVALITLENPCDQNAEQSTNQ